MVIKEWMSSPVITIDYNASLNDAAKLFRTRMISMLPVLKDGKLCGIVTKGDIKKAAPSDVATGDSLSWNFVKMSYIMSKPVITIRADHTVDEAAGIMLRKRISGLPVVDSAGMPEGVLTKSDVFRCFVSFTGVTNKGQVFVFNLPDKPGIIKHMAGMIRDSGGRLCSIMASYDDMEEGFRKVFFHTFDIDPDKFDSLVEKFYGEGELLYVADLSRGIRKILKC